MGALIAFPSGKVIEDVNNYDFNQEQALLMRPRCTLCGNPIQEEHAYCVQGMLVCTNCMKQFQINVEELMKE